MRRILFTVLACSALSVAAPAMASAHSGHHHKRHHHARVRHLKFLAHRQDSSTSGSPTTGTAPTAGTVTSFANNVLTITLANGNAVSGEVANDTEVNCENPEDIGDNGVEQNDMVRDDGPGGGDNSGDQGDNSGDQGDNSGDQGDDNDDQGDDNDNNDMCTITPGMAVQNAELTINGNGAFWNEVELVQGSTSSSTTTSS